MTASSASTRSDRGGANHGSQSQCQSPAADRRGKGKTRRGIYDSFATYVVFCGHCRYVRKTNMYIMRAEAFIDELKARGEVCPHCGKQEWTLGYPMGTTTGFVKF